MKTKAEILKAYINKYEQILNTVYSERRAKLTEAEKAACAFLLKRIYDLEFQLSK